VLRYFGTISNSQKSIVYEFGINKTKRQTKKYEVREDGRLVGGEEWQEKVCNRQEWKKLLRTARNCRILHMLME
jgi:hypothetical protein